MERHVELENQHDLEGVLGTFGNTAKYEDEACDERHEGRSGVRNFYSQFLKALPDLQIEYSHGMWQVMAIVLEVIIRGTHLGSWRGLPATGRRVEFRLSSVYTFDADDRLAGERIYYDRGTVLR